MVAEDLSDHCAKIAHILCMSRRTTEVMAKDATVTIGAIYSIIPLQFGYLPQEVVHHVALMVYI